VLKYASKRFLEIFLSVLATVVGAYIANHYVGGKSRADVSASSESTTVDPKGSVTSVVSQATAKANPTPTVDPSSLANPSKVATGPGERLLKAIDDHKASDEKVGMPVDKRAEVPSLIIRPRGAVRDSRILSARKAAIPAGPSPTFATARSHVPSEQVLAKENSSIGTVLEPMEIDRDASVPLLPESNREDSHFFGRVLGPMMRKALVLLRKPADWLRRESDERERISYEHFALSATKLDASEARLSEVKESVQRVLPGASE
jgi:hypothetical protein